MMTHEAYGSAGLKHTERERERERQKKKIPQQSGTSNQSIPNFFVICYVSVAHPVEQFFT